MSQPEDKPVVSSTEAFERALVEERNAKYVLRLYVTGSTPQSARAIANLRRICDEHLPGRFTLEVVDLYKDPQLAEGDQILAAPTLLKRLPPPLRRFVGDLSNLDRVLVGLDLRPRSSAEKR